MAEVSFGEMRWFPVKTVAKILGVSKQYVHRLAKSGRLSSRNVDGTTLISMRSVTEYNIIKNQRGKGENANR